MRRDSTYIFVRPMISLCECAHILEKRHTPSARTIAERIKNDLATPELEPVRAAIANLLDVLTAAQRQQRVSR